ncbi:MAG: glucose-6-phosphate isomerase [Alphaproteobacteria bacterium]|jgi:glucose-6-phosphate isomerase|nr:glucose-6-phosphate isomerase [Alphaproteobacteria bacterium]
MTFQHSIDDCLAERIGEGGLPRDEYEAALTRTGPVLDRLRHDWREGTSALLAQPSKRDDLAALRDVAEDWRRRFRRVFLLGIGGSSLGAQALTAALPTAAGTPELVVLDNLDLDDAGRLADPDLAADSGYLAVSKSGGTDESLSQALVAVDAVRAGLGAEAGADRFLMITEPGPRPLRQLAEEIGAPVLDHPTDIDGRYSVLTLVGMLPAMLSGIDAAEVRAGAEAALAWTLEAPEPAAAPAAQGAAIAYGLNTSRGVSQTVLMPYDARLRTFVLWYRQLWAESLGKSGRGTTPIAALGPVDQHSQLQLYLDGPWDKMFTLLTLPKRGLGPAIAADLAETVGLERLGGHRLGDLVAAMQRATHEALTDQGRPVRRLALERLDAPTMGSLFMHFTLETLIAAELFGVDPFGQPAVEAGKVLARRYLAEAGQGNGGSACRDGEA